jgi:2,4-dienoyl-CoA reductase-like NADH-dependent reductase (Old Yellow Enzyme family)
MPHLFDPIQIKSITFKNRLFMSPMCQYSATEGHTTAWHKTHYETRAIGGVGAIIVEATAISPEGRITPNDLGIWNDAHIPGLSAIADAIKTHGAVACIQLAHAGRKGSHAAPWLGGKQLKINEKGWQCIAPSAIAFSTIEEPPRAMNLSEIDQIPLQFAKAAKRAIAAGFDAIEIHSAHGYLLHEFLSPITNNRSDEFGGSFENRTKLLINTVRAVRSVSPENMPLFVRISASDWVSGGWEINESIKLSSILLNEGVDLIDCSSGGLTPDALIKSGPGFQVPFSSHIKQTGILTGAVGEITNAHQAESIVSNQQADVILIGRELLRQPYFALEAAHDLDQSINWPRPYLRGKKP